MVASRSDLIYYSAGRMVEIPKRARYRVHREARGNWQIEDRITGIKTYAGETWADAIEGVRARYDRLRRAQDYMHHFHPDQVDADEVIYAPGGWANG